MPYQNTYDGDENRTRDAILLIIRAANQLHSEPNMDEKELLKRITVNAEIFGGKPIIRGMRISVELVVSLLAQGESLEGILADYPDLTRDDIQACLVYAHAVIANDSLDAVHVG
jgi:uncharacterized protein (DUF433 family)